MDRFLLVSFLLYLVDAQHNQHYQTTTAVPILKQIDRHNEDGSYSYGYEAADGSFKIESKYPTGEVYGKYGFIDDTGKVREIEYGASQRGFEPAGTDINVPPSTVQGNNIAGPNEPEDDGQYREDPSVYHTDPKYTNGEYYRPSSKRPVNYNSASQRHSDPVSTYNPSAAPARIESQYQPTYQQQQYQPQYQTAQYQQEFPSPTAVDQVQYQQSRQYPNARSVYEQQEPLFREDVDSRSYPNVYSQ